MQTVLVTSAAGRVGKEVVARLRAARPDIKIRAACRRPEKAQYLKDVGADDVVKLEYTDESTYAAAVQGADALFSSSPDPALKGHEAFCKFLAANNQGPNGGKMHDIKHAVRLSCFGAEQNSASYDLKQHVSREAGSGAAVPHMLEGYWLGEKYLIDAFGKDKVTAVRANFFMSHLLKPDTENLKKEGWFALPFPTNARNSYVSTNDVGEIAAKCLLEGASAHGNKNYDITGPAPQSMVEVAADLEKAWGNKVEFRQQDKDKFIADFGPTRWEFIEYLLNGFYTRVAPDFYNLTGRRPTNYFEHLTEKGAAGETGLEELFNAPSMWTKGKDLFKEDEKKGA